MGWLAMIGYRHVWTGPIIVHVHSHIHIYVGPAGGRILSVYPDDPYADNGFLLHGYSAVLAATTQKKWSQSRGAGPNLKGFEVWKF